jgi:GcrA cell cycle regulator
MSDLPDWTRIAPAERDRLLTEYCQAGLTAQGIANKFQNCSRSAAIGRLQRMKLQLNNGKPRKGKVGRRPASNEAAPKTVKPAARRATKLVQQTSSWRGANNPPASDFKARAEQRAKSPGIVIKRENAFDPIPDTPPVAFGSPGCRWPVDGINGQGLLACGATKLHSDTSYCGAHTRLASAPTIHRLSVPRDA